MTIEPIMSRSVYYCEPDQTLEHAAAEMWEHDCGCLPVCATNGVSWQATFARLWPRGSDAQLSYGQRIVDGPPFSIDDALGRAPARGCAPLVA